MSPNKTKVTWQQKQEQSLRIGSMLKFPLNSKKFPQKFHL